jgi:hypothetical protein
MSIGNIFEIIPKELYHLIIKELDSDSFCNFRRGCKQSKEMCDAVIYESKRTYILSSTLNHNITISVNIVEGKMHGKYEYIRSKSMLTGSYMFFKMIQFYNKGEREGPNYEFDSEGNIESSFHFKQGLPHGNAYKVFSRSQHGMRILVTKYNNGLVVISNGGDGDVVIIAGTNIIAKLTYLCKDENHTNCEYK